MGRVTRRINTKRFLFEIALGYRCNLKCKYCYELENGKLKSCITEPDISNEIIEDSFRYIDYLISNDIHTTVYFWGGEPTLYFDKIEQYLERYKNFSSKQIKFLIKTNGVLIPKVLPNLSHTNLDKILVSLSYDYQPLQIKNRGIDITQTLEYLQDSDLKCGTHSACFNKDLGLYLYETYLNFIELNKKYPKVCKYFQQLPNFISEDDQPDLIKIQEQFRKINEYLIKNEIKDPKCQYYQNQNSLGSNSIDDICKSGSTMLFLNSDGKIYHCHGTSYRENKSNYCYGDIRELELIDILSYFYKNPMVIQPLKCTQCTNTFCIFCLMQQNEKKNQKFPNLFLDQPCSVDEYNLYKTITNCVKEYFQKI